MTATCEQSDATQQQHSQELPLCYDMMEGEGLHW
jgi:hypothetical protein